jgi:hypothetical protein
VTIDHCTEQGKGWGVAGSNPAIGDSDVAQLAEHLPKFPYTRSRVVREEFSGQTGIWGRAYTREEASLPLR